MSSRAFTLSLSLDSKTSLLALCGKRQAVIIPWLDVAALSEAWLRQTTQCLRGEVLSILEEATSLLSFREMQ
jgi:hypothetical protein